MKGSNPLSHSQMLSVRIVQHLGLTNPLLTFLIMPNRLSRLTSEVAKMLIGSCGQARTALYFASSSARANLTEPPAVSRPVGDDRWHKVRAAGRAGQMSEIF